MVGKNPGSARELGFRLVFGEGLGRECVQVWPAARHERCTADDSGTRTTLERDDSIVWTSTVECVRRQRPTTSWLWSCRDVTLTTVRGGGAGLVAARAGLRHVRTAPPNSAADFRWPPFWGRKTFFVHLKCFLPLLWNYSRLFAVTVPRRDKDDVSHIISVRSSLIISRTVAVSRRGSMSAQLAHPDSTHVSNNNWHTAGRILYDIFAPFTYQCLNCLYAQ